MSEKLKIYRHYDAIFFDFPNGHYRLVDGKDDIWKCGEEDDMPERLVCVDFAEKLRGLFEEGAKDE